MKMSMMLWSIAGHPRRRSAMAMSMILWSTDGHHPTIRTEPKDWPGARRLPFTSRKAPKWYDLAHGESFRLILLHRTGTWQDYLRRYMQCDFMSHHMLHNLSR